MAQMQARAVVYTFAERVRLAQQFAFFLLHSSGSCGSELHQVLAHRGALRRRILKKGRTRGGKTSFYSPTLSEIRGSTNRL